MLNQLAMELNVAQAGEIGLLMFLLIFLCVTIWTFSRSKSDITHWADIPLDHKSDDNTRN
jgi:cbb3-type cytochrome oxidase subunit 3